jgi:hypothetical protein
MVAAKITLKTHDMTAAYSVISGVALAAQRRGSVVQRLHRGPVDRGHARPALDLIALAAARRPFQTRPPLPVYAQIMLARARTLPTGFIAPCLPPDWLKCKNPACEAVKREAEEDWGR